MIGPLVSTAFKYSLAHFFPQTFSNENCELEKKKDTVEHTHHHFHHGKTDEEAKNL